MTFFKKRYSILLFVSIISLVIVAIYPDCFILPGDTFEEICWAIVEYLGIIRIITLIIGAFFIASLHARFCEEF